MSNVYTNSTIANEGSSVRTNRPSYVRQKVILTLSTIFGSKVRRIGGTHLQIHSKIVSTWILATDFRPLYLREEK